MSDQILTIIICGSLWVIAILFIAVVGTIPRIKFANSIFSAHKNRKIEELNKPNPMKKRRILIGLALITLTSIFILGILVFSGLLPFSTTLLVAYGFLTIISVTIGVAIVKDFSGKIEK